MNDKLLAARHGVFRDSEATLFGIGRDRSGAAKGHRMMRGIRCLLPPPWSAEARFTAAVLAGGEGALLTGDSWLQAMGIESLRPLAPVNVQIAHGLHRTSGRLAQFERSRLLDPAAADERQRLAIPLATDLGVASARSVVTGLASTLAGESVRGVLAKLSQQGITTPSEVAEWSQEHPRLAGAATAAWAARELAGGQDSEGEVRFLKLTHASRLPPDAAHVSIFYKGRLLSTTDAWWEIGVPGFYDGAVHFGKEQSDADIMRRELMRDAGLFPFIATKSLLDHPRLFQSRLSERQRQAAAAKKLWERTAEGVVLFPGL